MATSAISLVLTNLSTLIQDEVGLLRGVDKEMRKLSSTLSTMLAVLDDAELKQHRDKAIQNWLRKLRYAADKVGDILDECQTQAIRGKIKAQSSGSLKKVWTSAITRDPLVNLSFRHKIAKRMKNITEEINAIAEERKIFHLNEGFIEKGFKFADDGRESSSSLPPLEVIGRQDDKENIVKVLTQDVCNHQEFSVYPVIGMGGLGKTTLAQLIFNDERINSHFPLKIWVYVSQDFDVKRMMKQIIESASGKTCEASSLDCLENKVREMLSGKRYFLVLDDAWSEDQGEWDKLKQVLACGLPGACVMVTTRSEKVASITGTLPTHRLSYLSEDDCWLLFRQRAFGPGNEERPDLVGIGKEIVKKCGGVPLAAKALGGLMRFRRREKEWISIRESELWDIPLEECPILPALRLSYYNLPLKLRQCFSYCAVFLKGSEIDKDKLIQLWMANGFISSNGKLQVEDVGNMICDELYKRSFFLAEKKGQGGNLCFQMHDLIHDLAQSFMEHECHVMEAEVSCSITKQRIRHATLVDNCKHDGVFPKALDRHRSLHTILLQHRYPFYSRGDPQIEFSCDFKYFASLRVFDANKTRMMHLSESVGILKHLRYLDLSHTPIDEVPASICGLHNLQTLNLNYCYNIVRLPDKMKNLIGLRHLYLQYCSGIKDMPPKLGNLTQLKTLSLYVVGESRGQYLGELQHLDLGGKLEIKHLERVRNSIEAKEANLAGKQNIRTLALSWKEGDAREPVSQENAVAQQVIDALEPHPNVKKLIIKHYGGEELPMWMGNPSVLKNVVKIRLFKCTNCLQLPALGQLPCLKYLTIEGMEKVEYLIQNGNKSAGPVGAFPSLQELEIRDLPNLKGLCMYEGEENEGREQQPRLLPCLQMLYLHFCPQLTLIPELTSLVALHIQGNEDMISFPDAIVKNLPRLEYLNIIGFSKQKALKLSMPSLVTLKKLWIQRCEELECFPDGEIGSLTSLLEIKIMSCPKLASLPDNIQMLTQLQSLELWFCSPELARRCQKEIGEDWYKIAHVPDVRIAPYNWTEENNLPLQ